MTVVSCSANTASPKGQRGLESIATVQDGSHLLDIAMDVSVVKHLGLEGLELLLGGKLAVEEKEGRLEEAARLGELLDGVSTVPQNTVLAVDE